MRPIRLKMSAFGPYPDTVTIDMEQLGNTGLYLITGSTGAGKTTIFDAISFALFGEVSGEQRKSTMMRSKYALPGTPTQVEMSFLHGEQVYRILRNPAYERPKKNGDGYVSVPTDAQLFLPDGTIVTKSKEVTKRIEELLGVNRDQFSRIVMLAQGDFMKFLISGTVEKQLIFRNIFRTELFERFQNRLDEEYSQVYHRYKNVKSNLDQCLQKIECPQGEWEEQELDKVRLGKVPVDEAMAFLQKILRHDQSAKQEQEQELEKLEQELGQINQRIGKAEEAEKNKAALEQVKKRLESAQAEGKDLEEKFARAKAGLEQAQELQIRKASIEAQLPAYEELEQLIQETEKAKTQRKTREEKLEKDQEEQRKKSDKSKAFEEELAALQNTEAEKTRLMGESSRTQEYILELRELLNYQELSEQKRQELERAQGLYLKTDAEFREKKQEYDSLDQAYRDGKAGILASLLREGERCPVCGSTTHPMPAKLKKGVPTDEQLQEAKKLLETVRNELDKRAAKAGELRSSLETMLEQLNRMADKLLIDSEEIDRKGKKALQEALEQSRLLKTQLTNAEERLSRKKELEEQLPKIQSELRLLESSIGESQVELSALKTTIQNGETRIKAEGEKLEFADRDEAAARIRQLDNDCKERKELHRTTENAYRKKQEEISALQGKKEGYEQAIRFAQELDLSAELAEKAGREEKKQAVTARLQELVNRISGNRSALDSIRAFQKQLSSDEELLKWMGALTDTANGRLNGKDKVKLETYVQSAFFDRILQRANVRLLEMTNGRYELLRREEAENGRSQSGLDLEVLDLDNASIRDVRTLSGGESFMASLCLALGLSDEVQCSAGGIRLDTMFVDEGFGSLDGESLDQAYKALTGLAGGNKLVGIISHVTELKDRIDKQIIVTKTGEGKSTVTVRV